MNQIVAEFTLTPNDYAKAVRDSLPRKIFPWLISGWFGFPLLAVLFMFFINQHIDMSNFGRFVFGLALGSVALMQPFLIPADVKKKIIEIGKTKVTQRYTFSDEGISIISADYEVKHNWSLIKEVSESKKFYFLIQADNSDALQFIPKSAFQSQEQDSAFRSLISRHVSDIKAVDKGIRGWKLWAVASILSLFLNLGVFMMIGD
jgi:hypothetical protein